MQQEEFSESTRLWTIRHEKVFAPFKNYLICPRNLQILMQVYRLKDLSLFYPFHAKDTALALNEMKKRGKEGETLFIPFAKKDTGIYQFLIGKNRPFVLILPGGAYGDVCSLIEGFHR